MSEINESRVPVRLTVTGILEDLSKGLTRPEIRTKYRLSAGDMTALFQHPSLKGRKPSKVAGFILVDDTVEQREETIFTTPIVEEVEEERVSSDMSEQSLY